MLRLIAIPLPVTIYALVLSAAALLLSVPLLITGTLPRWLPSGLVDPRGQRALLSPGIYRLLGVAGVLAGIGAGVATLGTPSTSILIAFGFAGIAFTCLVIAAAEAWSERRQRRKTKFGGARHEMPMAKYVAPCATRHWLWTRRSSTTSSLGLTLAQQRLKTLAPFKHAATRGGDPQRISSAPSQAAGLSRSKLLGHRPARSKVLLSPFPHVRSPAASLTSRNLM